MSGEEARALVEAEQDDPAKVQIVQAPGGVAPKNLSLVRVRTRVLIYVDEEGKVVETPKRGGGFTIWVSPHQKVQKQRSFCSARDSNATSSVRAVELFQLSRAPRWMLVWLLVRDPLLTSSPSPAAPRRSSEP